MMLYKKHVQKEVYQEVLKVQCAALGTTELKGNVGVVEGCSLCHYKAVWKMQCLMQ